ncbi:MAG: helix-turn-helix domain-containing protein [Patescibacteria group bacterium]
MAQQIQATLTGIFENLGLSSSEIPVLLFLLESANGLRATEIARKTRVNRTTLYGILKSLTSRGLVSSSEENGIMRFQSIQPHQLTAYIESAKQRLESDTKRLDQVIPALAHARKAKDEQYPQIQFFSGVEGIKQVYEDTLRDNPSKAIYGFFDYEATLKLMDTEWPNYYIKKRTEAGIESHTIATYSPLTRTLKEFDKDYLRVTKEFPEGFSFAMEISAYGDKTMLISFNEDHPLAIIIKDARVAETIKTLFRYIDSTLPD